MNMKYNDKNKNNSRTKLRKYLKLRNCIAAMITNTNASL